MDNADEKFEKVFRYIEDHAEDEPKIFFDGQIYDAFSLIVSLIQKAQKEIILIDEMTVYHIGASIKDAGKKCFGMLLWQGPSMVADLLNRLKKV